MPQPSAVRLRLYAARASRDFDMQIFNDGDYFKAVEQKISSETISKVLYPSDAVVAVRELRLLQEYFLVACAIRRLPSGRPGASVCRTEVRCLRRSGHAHVSRMV